MNEKLPKIVSLFCGAGGLDLGFAQEGFDLSVAIDHSCPAIETHKRNFPSCHSVVGDLAALGASGVLKVVEKIIPRGERIGVIGGPPCQGFSRANTQTTVDDERNLLPFVYSEIVKLLSKHYVVEFLVFENVSGFKEKRNKKVFNHFVDVLSGQGFDLNIGEYCALDFGVPQLRNRVILTAFPKKPENFHIEPSSGVGVRTVREAIGALVDPVFFKKGMTSRDIPHHPNHWAMMPKSYRFLDPSLTTSDTRSFKRLRWDSPSPTVAYGNREIHVHPSGTRRLSIYEAMLIQGFPESYVLAGNLSEQVQQVSNAVPPPLAKAIAKSIKRAVVVGPLRKRAK